MRAALALFALATLPALAQQKLELEKALPLDGPEFIAPAGLAFSEGKLYLASATSDEALFEVDLSAADKAAYKASVKLKLPKDAGEGDRKLAFRGLAPNPKGGFFLLSESACRILKVTSGGKGEWEGPSLLEAGAEKGLFAGENAGAEGLLATGPGKFLVAASREPRGLIEADLSGEKPVVTAFVMGKPKLPLARGRKADFSDLVLDGARVLALSSGADAVEVLSKKGQEYAEGPWWTFGHVSNDPKYKYGLPIGLAHALAVDEKSIYVALDNKGVARAGDPADKRPLLLIFKKPH